jgi:hypothetical protein
MSDPNAHEAHDEIDPEMGTLGVVGAIAMGAASCQGRHWQWNDGTGCGWPGAVEVMLNCSRSTLGHRGPGR